MVFVEPPDGPFRAEPPEFREPLPPEDRIWRHPSELSGTMAPPAPPPRPGASSTRRLWSVALVSAMSASLLSLGLVAVAGGLNRSKGVTTAVERQVEPRAAVGPASALAVVEIAERSRAAIVQLRIDGGEGGERGGSGSGVIFRSDGHVLTNAHVVEGASSVRVVLSNGREVGARVVGADRETDSAVVKMEGGPYPVATLGTAVDLKVGQPAIAIGSPLGLAGGPSVTVGVVSALHRRVRAQGDTSLVDMIQTDAPIAPGSSGGSLLDGDGTVIGITTAIAVSDVGAEGLGFATPIDLARAVAEQLITSGRVTNVWLGVEGSDLDGATANELDVDGGALLGQVKEDSPARRAGLQARDIIIAVDGRPVSSMGALVVALRQHRPGDKIEVEMVRDRDRHRLPVTLVERPPGE